MSETSMGNYGLISPAFSVIFKRAERTFIAGDHDSWQERTYSRKPYLCFQKIFRTNVRFDRYNERHRYPGRNSKEQGVAPFDRYPLKENIPRYFYT
jgi:hypothetical protein